MTDKEKIDRFEKAMIESVINTFEDMAFLDVIISSERKEISTYNNIVSIDIKKPFLGKFYWCFPENLKIPIIDNIMNDNIDNNHHDDELYDCLLEIMNVMSGNILSEYFNHSVEYKIGFPNLIYNSHDEQYNDSIIKYFIYDNISFAIKFEYNKDNFLNIYINI